MAPEEWAALGTMTTAVVAVAAAIFAFMQVRETRRSREEQTRPFVVVDIQPSRVWANLLNLVVENVGSTVAMNVQLTFEPPLMSSQEDFHIGESSLLRDGIPMVPPGRRIEALFDVSHDRIESGLPSRYDVTVELDNARGRAQEPQRYVLDVGYLYGLMRVDEYGLHHVATSLREIEKRVKKWSDIHGRLKVWVRDEDRRRQKEEAEQALTGKYPALGRKPPPEVLTMAATNVVVRMLVRSARRIWEVIRSSLQKAPRGRVHR